MTGQVLEQTGTLPVSAFFMAGLPETEESSLYFAAFLFRRGGLRFLPGGRKGEV